MSYNPYVYKYNKKGIKLTHQTINDDVDEYLRKGGTISVLKPFKQTKDSNYVRTPAPNVRDFQ